MNKQLRIEKCKTFLIARHYRESIDQPAALNDHFNKDLSMTNNTEVQATAKAYSWTYLDWFQIITEEHYEDHYRTPVFRNGRQQVPIAIHLTARNALGEFHTITEIEMQSLRIIDYYTGSTISHEWRKNEFDYYRDYVGFLDKSEDTLNTSTEIKDIGEPAPRAGLQVIYLWITTESPEVLRIGARITAPDGTLFSTNSPNAAPGGGPTNGKFNSSLSVVSMAPIRYTLADFKMEGSNLISDALDVDYYRISFIHPRLRIVQSIQHTPPTMPAPYYQSGFSPFFFQIFYEAGPPRREAFSHHGFSVEYDINVPEGTATAVRIVGIGGHIEERRNHAQITLIDNFGNESDRLWLNPSSTGNWIYLSATENTVQDDTHS